MGNPVDVLVVGAGPAGAVSALSLARMGYSVLLVDRCHFPRAKACGEYLSPGVIDSLARLGVGELVRRPEARRVPGMEIVSPRGHVLRISYSDGELPVPAYTVPRSDLDEMLVRAAQHAGAELREGFVARAPLIEGGMVRGIRGMQDGDAQEVRARITIVADGSRSVMVRRLGLTRAVRWPTRLGLVAYFAGSGELRDGYGQMHVARGGYCGIAPLSNNRLNVAVVIPYRAGRRSGQSATRTYERWIADHPAVGRTLQGCLRETSVRGVAPIGTRAARSSVAGALLVGDAAGFFDPFTGEGIFRALEGAQLAARVAHTALQSNDMSEHTLRTYDEMRYARFRWKQRTTALVQLFVQFPALSNYALPRLARRPVPRTRLSMALGDIGDARAFLAPEMLWAALRP